MVLFPDHTLNLGLIKDIIETMSKIIPTAAKLLGGNTITVGLLSMDSTSFSYVAAVCISVICDPVFKT